MEKSSESKPENNLKYVCPVCGKLYSDQGWCPELLIGKVESLQPHPRVQVIEVTK